MGAGIALLADDGDLAVVGSAVTIAVEVLDRLDLGGMRRDFNFVALGAIEVADHVFAKTVDPVIVNGVVLAGDANPVDGAVGIDVFCHDFVLGVDHSFEAEGVGAAAAGQGVVDRLERGGLSREDLGLAVLRCDHLAGIGAAQQHVVAGAAVQFVGAEATDQKVVAGAAGELVVAGAAPDLVIAGPPLSMSLPAMPATVSLLPPANSIPACRPVQMVMAELPPVNMAKKSSKRLSLPDRSD